MRRIAQSTSPPRAPAKNLSSVETDPDLERQHNYYHVIAASPADKTTKDSLEPLQPSTGNLSLLVAPDPSIQMAKQRGKKLNSGFRECRVYRVQASIPMGECYP
uniref:Uncharacterized protein n=1 Tax=Branchiostoma floridae TaxID=7739 RepID=C3Z3E8_BRAFL|eukprot:XP_002596980.1 hypothetical protein BRAFLDRAFT_76479 [Branchiostoma floridae]